MNEPFERIADYMESLLETASTTDRETNATDALVSLGNAAQRIAAAITPNVCGSSDDAGKHVESLTEAVMGMTAGLCRIADAITELSEAVYKLKE